MGARVSLTALLSTSTLSGPARVSLSTLNVAEALSGPVRMSHTSALVANALSGVVRVSGTYVLVARSTTNGIQFERLESDSELYSIDGWTFTIVSSGGSSGGAVAEHIPEHNPYRPTIPETIVETMGTEGYDYLKENQEIQREQHNFTQAGDTTFPHQLMQKPHSNPHYTLGSVSRFYHKDYGLIQARYVQFTKMVPVATPCCPVGFVKKKGATKWSVTNDLSRSDPNLVVGMLAPYTIPAEGEYGWVITDGPNLQPAQNVASTAELGEGFSWAETGKLSPTATGKVIARRVVKPTNASSGAVVAGNLHIAVESASNADIAAVADKQVAPVIESVAALQDQVDALKTTSNPTDMAALLKSIATLISKLGLETDARASADSAINARIDGLGAVSPVDLTNAITDLQTWVSNQLATIETEIDTVRTLAETTAGSAVGIDSINDLQRQIDAIRATVIDLGTRRLVVETVAGAYTFVSSDAGKHKRFTNAGPVAATIDLDTFEVGDRIRITSAGAGLVTLTPVIGVTLNSRDNAYKSGGQFAVFEIECVADNEYDVLGDVTA